MTGSLLKLSAYDEADLQVLSSLLQDSVVPLSDMAFLREERCFALAVSRFRWEAIGDGVRAQGASASAEPAGERVNCGIRFEGVQRVMMRGIDPGRRDHVLELSALHYQDEKIVLLFAGGAMVRLEVDGILCHLEDFGAPWPTMFRPDHGPETSTQD
ncbi:MAG: DUF2948 family protein [Alphaproteobacteria bacterium]|nr:DUF2948 family protein [Alphaproteobacteria bacterium]